MKHTLRLLNCEGKLRRCWENAKRLSGHREKCEGVVKIQNDSQDTSIRERRTVKVLGKFRKTLMTRQ